MISVRPADDTSHTIDELLMYFSTLKIKNELNLQHSLEALTYSIVSAYDVDRCGIWLFDQSKSMLTCKNLYSRKTATYSAGQQIILSAFPEYFNAIKTSRALTVGNVRESELTNTFYQKYLIKINVNSIINCGIWENGELIGVLTLADIKNNREFNRSHSLSLIPFADLCGRWINSASNKLQIKKKFNFNNEALLREVSYLCKKSESLPNHILIKKALRSFSTLLNTTNIHAVLFNQLEASLFSTRRENKDAQKVDSFQAQSLFKIAKNSKILWIQDHNNLAVGLPSLLRTIVPNSNSSLAIIPSNISSGLNFVLIIEFASRQSNLEKEIGIALDQIVTAFSIILEHADTKSILKESLSLAKGAFDCSNIGMAVFDNNSRLIRVNKSLKSIVEDNLSLIQNIIPKSILEDADYLDINAHKGSQTIILPSGEEKHLYIDSSKIESNNSSASFFLLQVLDISKQKRAITALKEQEKLFKSVIDLSPAFIFAKSIDGTFVLANESVSEVYGTTPEAMVGKKDSDFNNDPVEVKKFREDDARVILGKKEICIPEEKITDSKGNTRYLQTVKKPILNPHDHTYLVLGVSTDVTARKHAEEREKKWLREIEHTQKLESLGLLAGGIAHDFNNLLQAIIGNCSLSLRSIEGNNETSNYLKKVLIAGEKASSLCNQLLCYSKNKPISKIRFDLNNLVRECSSIFERIISKNVKIAYEIKNHLPLILGDKTQLEQVIMNLVTNAIEAASEGGQKVTIRTRTEYNNFEFLVLEVEDNGLGIPEEILDKIFQPFFTTKTQGRGLGLSAVKGIIENHGGSLEVVSTPEMGSIFKVLIPCIQSEDNSILNDEINISSQVDLRGKSIILVDDEALSREVSNEMLSISGANTLSFDNALSTLCRLKDKNLVVDAIILDLNMPIMSGEDAFYKIRSMRPNIPILIISGYSEQMNIEKLLCNPKTSYLSKPYSYDQLVNAVIKCLAL